MGSHHPTQCIRDLNVTKDSIASGNWGQELTKFKVPSSSKVARLGCENLRHFKTSEVFLRLMDPLILRRGGCCRVKSQGKIDCQKGPGIVQGHMFMVSQHKRKVWLWNPPKSGHSIKGNVFTEYTYIHNRSNVQGKWDAAAYQLGNTGFRMINEVKQR